MAVLSASSAWHVAINTTAIRYCDGEKTTAGTGLSWESAWTPAQAASNVGVGGVTLFKACDTPYRFELNTAVMADDLFICDLTGVGFERGAKKADFRASNTFNFSYSESNIYSASIPDVLTGAGTGSYSMDYPGNYIFQDTLNFEGAWGVWRVTGSGASETVVPLTRVMSYAQLSHGKWYWSAGAMYICWVGSFSASEFEVVQRAKCFEMWSDPIPTDAMKSSMAGIKSRFGLFGHHNGACVGWRISDCELSWNALDGLAIIAENTYAKAYGLYTQIVRCHIHHNYRDGITNYTTPGGAAGRGHTAWPDVNADFCYIHDNGGAGVFLHRLTRFNVTTDYQSADYPARLTNNTITRNGRGVALTDERMAEMIETFGYDAMVPDQWEAMSYAQKVAFWNSLNSGYDTSYVLLRNNNICDNDVDADVVTGTFPGTAFVVDSDYNNIWPGSAPWSEGVNSMSVDPLLSDEASISFSSPLFGAGGTPFLYPTNTDATSRYFEYGAAPYTEDSVGELVNIGAGSDGPGILRGTSSWRMPSFTLESSVSDATATVSNPVVAIGTAVAGAMAEVLYESSSEDGVIFGQWATWPLATPPILRFSDTATCKLQSIELIRGEA